MKAGENVPVSVEVRNSGAIAGEEVVQLYITDDEAYVLVPIRTLQDFTRIALDTGEKMTVRFTLTPYQLSLIDAQGKRVLEPGSFTVSAGGKQPGFTGAADAATTGVITKRFTVTGGTIPIN